MDKLLTIREVADLTGLSVGTLYHFVSESRIPVIRISRRCIRFRQSALTAWFDSLTQHGDSLSSIQGSRDLYRGTRQP